MNKHFLNLAMWLFFLAVVCMTGCSDENTYPDVDGQEPVAALKTTHIQSGAGHSFTIEGTLTDADGIAFVKLECQDLYLNKTIDLIEIYGEPNTSYDLSYNFNLQADEIGEKFTIKVTVTDVGGRSVSQDVLITMDGDFENPKFVSVPEKKIVILMSEGAQSLKYNLNLSVTDDRALDYLMINIEGLDGYSSLKIPTEGKTEFNVTKEIVLPNVNRNYSMTITVVDKSGKSVVSESLISVIDVVDFEKMYLADVETVEELNSDVFGVPMLIEHTGEYTYEANYYNKAAGTKIYFLPQKSDFAPVCFGLDPTDETRLINKSSKDGVNPMVLDVANVYYNIKLNILDGSYSIETYSVNDAQDPWSTELKYNESTFDLWGNGSEYINFTFGLTETNPTEVKPFTQDENNPHLFYSEKMNLAAGKMHFIIHNYHKNQWWNAVRWCSISSTDVDIFGYYESSKYKNPLYNGPKNSQDVWSEPEVLKSGTYRFYFDSHLGRAKLIKE